MDMKEFNLKEAQAGKPICTCDGREARIICWDSKGDECSLIVAVRSKTDETLEEIITYDKNGMHPANDESSPDNLMIDLEKRKLYVNIYKNKDGIYVSRVRDNSDIETLNLASSFLIGTICVTLEDNEIVNCNKSV